MSCRYRKSASLTSLFRKTVWVSSDEPPLCEGKIFCGAVGSQSSPVAFSGLFPLLESLVSSTEDVLIYFNAGVYSLPDRQVFVFPAFRTVILRGEQSLLTEIHGTWRFASPGGTLIIQNLTLRAPTDAAAVEADGVSLEFSNIRIFGASEGSLLSVTDSLGYKMSDLKIYQEKSGWCFSETNTDSTILAPIRQVIDNILVESRGGFYRTTNDRPVKKTLNVSGLVGISKIWFDILDSSGDETFRISDFQIETSGEENVLLFKGSGTGSAHIVLRGGEVQAPEGGVFQASASDRARVFLDIADSRFICARTYRHFEGMDESLFKEINSNITIDQDKDADAPLLICNLRDSSSFQCNYTTARYRSESSFPLETKELSGNSKIAYTGFGNEFCNSGMGGIFLTETRDKAQITLKCNSERAEAFAGVIEDVSARGESSFGISKSSYEASTKEGSVNFYTGSGNCKISNKMNDVTQIAGPNHMGDRTAVSRLDLSGSCEYVMTANGVYKNYDLSKNEIGTQNILRDQCTAVKTRLNEFFEMGAGTAFQTSTHDDTVFRSNTSNFQGTAGTCFRGDTHDRSVMRSQKANMIVSTGTLVDRNHESEGPFEDITTVSGVVRDDPSRPLYVVRAKENHGDANLRVTNTVMRCESADPDTPPVLVLQGCKTGDELCGLQLSITNSRVATNACKVLGAERAVVNLVSSEATSITGTTLFDLKECKCDTRASSIVGEESTGFENRDSQLTLNASSLTVGKVCFNSEKSECLLNTSQISVPQRNACIEGGVVSQSSSNCLTGSFTTTDASLRELASELRNEA